MIIAGAMLLVWGALILGLARPLHENWRKMVGQLRAAGHRPPFGTRYVGSPEGLRAMRIVGASGAVVGAVLLAAGLARTLLRT